MKPKKEKPEELEEPEEYEDVFNIRDDNFLEKVDEFIVKEGILE